LGVGLYQGALVLRRLARFAEILGRRRVRVSLLALSGLIVVFLAWSGELGRPRPPKKEIEPDTIEYHYERLLQFHARGFQDAPTGIRDIDLNKVLWYLDGKPSLRDQFARMNEHYDALDRLGYLEQQRFEWRGTNRDLFVAKLFQNLTNPGLSICTQIQFEDTNSHGLYIKTRKSDMMLVSNLVQRVNASLVAQTNRVTSAD
jgi:hypothetical protein